MCSGLYRDIESRFFHDPIFPPGFGIFSNNGEFRPGSLEVKVDFLAGDLDDELERAGAIIKIARFVAPVRLSRRDVDSYLGDTTLCQASSPIATFPLRSVSGIPPSRQMRIDRRLASA